MNWSRLTVNLEPELAALAKTRAKAQRRSFAAYVAHLIEQDVASYPEREKTDLIAAEDAAVRTTITREAGDSPHPPEKNSARTKPPRR